MKKRYIVASLALLAVLTVGLIGFYLSGLTQNAPSDTTPTPAPTQTIQPTDRPTNSAHPTPTTTSSNQPQTYTYTVVNTYPHNTNAFTEGLVFDNNVLYESTGEFGTSSLRRVNVSTGSVLQQVNLSSDIFGEGIAVVNDSIIQLTWQNGIGFVYDKDTFALKGNFTIGGEGWGLTYDGARLIMSNGSSVLTFLDPVTFQPIGAVNVKDGNTAVPYLNELEFVNGDVYANIWMQQKIAVINPQTGQIKGYLDLTGIHQPKGNDDVLNGIAYDQTTGHLFVTGKNWPTLYEIVVKNS